MIQKESYLSIGEGVIDEQGECKVKILANHLLMEYAPESELFDQVVREREKGTMMSNEQVYSKVKISMYLRATTYTSSR